MPIELPTMKDFEGQRIVGVDLETQDPYLKEYGPGSIRQDGKICGISLAVKDGRTWYLPIAHGSGNLDFKQVINFMKELSASGIDSVGANYIYDLDWMKSYGIEWKGKVYCCQLTESLLDENRLSFKLDKLAEDYFGLHKKEEKMVEWAESQGYKAKDVKTLMHIMPAEIAAEYAEEDAKLALDIFLAQLPKIKDEELTEVLELEQKLTKVLLKVRYHGVRVDREKAEAYNKKYIKIEEELKKELMSKSKTEFNPWSSDETANFLDQYNIKYNLSPKKGDPSITEQSIYSANKKLTEEQQGIVDLLFKFRTIGKNRRDFLEGTLLNDKVAIYYPDKDEYRIHCQFHQNRKDSYGTRSGRLSSSNPNLQNQPSRDKEWAKVIRGCYLPDKGYDWIRADYSQQEYRLFAHYAAKSKLPGASKVVEQYNKDPRTDYHQMVADIVGIDRKKAKNVNFGIIYGQGVRALANDLRVSQAEAKELLAEYHEAIPFAKIFQNQCRNVVRKRGYVFTYLGRRRRFNLWEPKKNQEEWDAGIFFTGKPLEQAKEEWPNRILQRHKDFKGLNSLIQGSAADMTKAAWVALDEAGYLPPIQVHDELDFVNINREDVPKIKKIMEEIFSLDVPIIADCEIGPNWGELEAL